MGFNLQYKGYGYLVEADIKGFFDTVDHAWLQQMLAQRIDNKRLRSLIQQWLKAEVVKPGRKGRAMLIRYCDDFVVAFQLRQDAHAFYRTLPQRQAKFNLAIAPEKTRLMRFSRFHPGTQHCFRFLGLEFYWSTDRRKQARWCCRISTNKQHELMSTVYRWIKLNRHQRLSCLMPAFKRKLVGIANYFGLPDNSRSLTRLYRHVVHSLYKWLNRRSQRHSYNWIGLKAVLNYYGIQPLRVWNDTMLW
ncbi:reverse transcriptase domain-containing protein [Thiohalophilus sp.]|uniref:reverse transcriptase domain-containing protein n=1 Tax=Thiohalophilus sp. TaxID=3028392 RepID=UPI002ACE2E8F|nr:reverse transcriptase domain-containing protein [Thiohalophilus sp.]MDZ7803414.1 reverse transcriptase domain-containing protein [Thiohalophilus sp.]